MTEDEIRESGINGDICEVFGHRWSDMMPEHYTQFTKNYLGELIQATPVRVSCCQICGEGKVLLPERWEKLNSIIK